MDASRETCGDFLQRKDVMSQRIGQVNSASNPIHVSTFCGKERTKGLAGTRIMAQIEIGMCTAHLDEEGVRELRNLLSLAVNHAKTYRKDENP
jgi:hypothetical protein